MKYNDLIAKLKPRKAIIKEMIDYKNKKITVTYLASTLEDKEDKVIYNIEFSKELEDLLKETGEEYGKVRYVDKDEDTVIAYPDYYINYEKYKSWKSETTYFVLYDNKVVNKEIFRRTSGGNTYIKGYLRGVEKCVNIWKDNLVAVKGEYYVLVTPNGDIKNICYSAEPESGREEDKEVWISGDIFYHNIYEYYDCDLKHGGWNEMTYDLNKYLE
jgi:hypothetical protein